MSATPEEQAVIDAAHDNVIACSELHDAQTAYEKRNGCDEVTRGVITARYHDAVSHSHRTHLLMRENVHKLLQERAREATAHLQSEVDELSAAVKKAAEETP